MLIFVKKIFNIAHRGAKGYYPENTLIAFEQAILMKADGIELDVHLSLDGEIIVIHDATIERTTNRSGTVNELTVKELQRFSINEHNKIPTLIEVINLVDKRCFINIELKSFDTVEQVAAIIERFVKTDNWTYDLFLVSSFDWIALQQLRNLNGSIPIGVLTATDLTLAFSFAKFVKAQTINPYFHLLTKKNCSEMQSENLLVYAWTVNEIDDIKEIISYGIDGIISDFPDRLSTIIAS